MLADEGANIVLGARRAELVEEAAVAKCVVPGQIETQLLRNWVQRTADELKVGYEDRLQQTWVRWRSRPSARRRKSPVWHCSWFPTKRARSQGSRSTSTPAKLW